MTIETFSAMGAQSDSFDAGSPFADEDASSFRPTGLAIALAILGLLVFFIALLAVAVFMRRRQQAKMRAAQRKSQHLSNIIW